MLKEMHEDLEMLEADVETFRVSISEPARY
jgi:hypothetical protein